MTAYRRNALMNKATRMLAVTGMTLLAGLTFGATPALAGSASVTAGTTAGQAAPGADHVQDHFWNLRDCLRSGRWGERRGDWDSYRCRRDWNGRGYVLLVDN